MIKGVCQFNPRVFLQWCMQGLLIGLVMMAWSGQAQANGG